MKLRIKALALPTGTKLVLVDEGGTMLPNQTALTFDNTTDRLASVTVTFAVDGDEVALLPTDPA